MQQYGPPVNLPLATSAHMDPQAFALCKNSLLYGTGFLLFLRENLIDGFLTQGLPFHFFLRTSSYSPALSPMELTLFLTLYPCAWGAYSYLAVLWVSWCGCANLSVSWVSGLLLWVSDLILATCWVSELTSHFERLTFHSKRLRLQHCTLFFWMHHITMFGYLHLRFGCLDSYGCTLGADLIFVCLNSCRCALDV